MKLDMTRFLKDQTDHQALQIEAVGEIELSSTELQAVCGGSYCPRSNDFFSGRSFYRGGGYDYDGFRGSGRSFYQGGGYDYDGFLDRGYGNGFDQRPCQVPQPPCPYSY